MYFPEGLEGTPFKNYNIFWLTKISGYLPKLQYVLEKARPLSGVVFTFLRFSKFTQFAKEVHVRFFAIEEAQTTFSEHFSWTNSSFYFSISFGLRTP